MKKLILFIFAVILAVVLSVYDTSPIYSIFNKEPEQFVNDELLHVYYLDVSQADSIFVKLPDGENMLIDAGNKEDGDKIKNKLRSLGVKKINYLVATHPHSDHIGGMEAVVRAFDIENIYMTNAPSNTETFEKLLLAIKQKGKTINIAKAGVDILSKDTLSIKFVAPNSDSYEDLNNYSAIIKLTYKNTSFLFTGDAEKLSEGEISENIKCDVLKVGHHGSNSSTSAAFLKKVKPEYAVISCGFSNSYGHPHKEVISRLKAANIKIYRTDLDGTVEAISDGSKIIFNTERGNLNEADN